jgi:hypothetical protein
MMNPTDDFLAPELASLVDAELAKGEHIDWIGQPIPSRLALSGVPIALFGIPFTAFALFWMGMASGIRGPGGSGLGGFFFLFGIPLVVVGLGMLGSPFWMYLKAVRTVYAITDRRALAIERDILGRFTTRSFEGRNLAILSRTQRADGSGNLVFQREYYRQGRNGRFVDIGFFAIPDVKAVEDRIRELMRKANVASGSQR